MPTNRKRCHAASTMNKIILSAIALLLSISWAYGQQVITLTEDMVLSDTWQFTENTTVIGNGFSLICENCNPMIEVAGAITVDFQDVIFDRSYTRWLRHTAKGGMVTWNSSRMRGSSTWSEADQ